MAARRSHETVQIGDFTDALEKILLGAERKIMLSREETRAHGIPRARYALLGMLIEGADPYARSRSSRAAGRSA